MSTNLSNQCLLSSDPLIFANTLSISLLAFSAGDMPGVSRIPIAASRVMNALSTRQSANHWGLPPAVAASVMLLRLVVSLVISGDSSVAG